MPEDNQEPQEVFEETPTVENAQEGKRRIKPVIEEISSNIPAMSDEEKAEDPKVETNGGEEIDSKSEDKKEMVEVEKEKEKVPDQPVETHSDNEQKTDLKLFVVIAVVTAVIVAALAGGIYVYLTGTSNITGAPTSAPKEQAIVESTPEPSPEGSPSAAMKVADYKVQILNGSGKIGEAGKAKTLIGKDEFVVSNTGNAESFDFTDTIIQAKSSVPEEVLTALEKSLSSTYSVKIGDNLSTSSSYDIIVTIGSK